MSRGITLTLAGASTALLLLAPQLLDSSSTLAIAIIGVGLSVGSLAVMRAWWAPLHSPDQSSIDGSFAGPT